jgi:hypothetical protein
MTFDDWMLGVSERHKPSDDGVMLRMLRACWIEAQAAERERCAKLCEEWAAVRSPEHGGLALRNVAERIRGPKQEGKR